MEDEVEGKVERDIRAQLKTLEARGNGDRDNKHYVFGFSSAKQSLTGLHDWLFNK